MKADHFSSDVQAFLRSLSTHDVRYLVIGGLTETIELDGTSVPVHIISLQDLISSKRAAGRPKDLDDLQNLEG